MEEEELLNTFSAKITERRLESSTKELEGNSASISDKYNTKDANNKTTEKSVMACNAMEKIAADCDDILSFLQAVAVKAQQFADIPLLMCAGKRAQAWFYRCLAHHLASLFTPVTAAPQDHSILTRVLINVTKRLHNVEYLCPIVAVYCEDDRDMRGWDHLPLTLQLVILAASANNSLTIPSAPPPLVHQFLNARNARAFQAYSALIYMVHNI